MRTQKLLESLHAAQPESRTILFDLALVSLKQGSADFPSLFVYQQQALRGVTHPYQRRVLDGLAQDILYGREVMDKTTLTLADVLLDVPSAASKKATVGSSRDPAERAGRNGKQNRLCCCRTQDKPRNGISKWYL